MGANGPRVLILTASYGSGHNRVARALAEACTAARAVPRVVDHFRELVHPAFDRLSRALYYAILRRAAPLWGAAYWIGDQLSVSSPLLLGMNRLGALKLHRLLREESPDFVVSVHPTPAGAFSELRARRLITIPHTTVFTDFVAHTQWIHPGVDRYCVPAEAIKNDLVARGVPGECTVVTGVPVASEFAQPRDRASARLALGLSPRLPVLLAMAGSLGSLGDLVTVARAIRDLPLQLQAIIVTGQDTRLAARIRRIMGDHGHFRVLTYSDSIRQLMAAADLLVTKGGGVTLAEALAAELPIVCFGSLPGQESRNERFAGMTGVALRARAADDLRGMLSLALTDAEVIRRLRAKTRELRRPDAARLVIECVLSGAGRIAERAS
jgi:processive 1,2-diacylglycerol beta-glucosyltransferase